MEEGDEIRKGAIDAHDDVKAATSPNCVLGDNEVDPEEKYDLISRLLFI